MDLNRNAQVDIGEFLQVSSIGPHVKHGLIIFSFFHWLCAGWGDFPLLASLVFFFSQFCKTFSIICLLLYFLICWFYYNIKSSRYSKKCKLDKNTCKSYAKHVPVCMLQNDKLGTYKICNNIDKFIALGFDEKSTLQSYNSITLFYSTLQLIFLYKLIDLSSTSFWND